MFETIYALATQAKVSGLNINVRPATTEQALTVVVSFLLPSFDSSKVFDSEKSESQDFINLRAALATPVVITAPVTEIEAAITQALRDLSAPVVEASTTLAAIDLKTLLATATAAAPKASPVKTAKSPKAETATKQVELEDDADEQETEETTVSQPVVNGTDIIDFDSL